MFGMGMGEIVLIAIVALLFLGPEKLPDAAKTISKGIRDFRKQTRELQQIVEDDHEIGDAIRDIKSALRGEEPEVAERRRRAIEAARKAADNAAKAAEEMARKREAEGPKTVSVDAGLSGDATDGAGLHSFDDGLDDDRDVATVLGISGDDSDATDDAESSAAEAGTGRADDFKALFRPVAGAVAYTPKPLFADDEPDDGPDDEPDAASSGDHG